MKSMDCELPDEGETTIQAAGQHILHRRMGEGPEEGGECEHRLEEVAGFQAAD